MEWVVLFDVEFNDWFEVLEQGLQDEIWAYIELLGRFGPNLGRPRVDTVKSSAFSNIKELRIQYHFDPWCILFAFDPSTRWPRVLALRTTLPSLSSHCWLKIVTMAL